MNCTIPRRGSFVPAIISLVLLSGCQVKSERAATEPLHYLRGTVQQVGDQLLFTPCYEQTTHILSDLSGRISKRVARREEPLFYAELSVSQAQAGILTVHQTHLLGGGVATCRYELEDIDYRAAGDKPLWIADVSGDQVTVHNYKTLSRHRFKQVQLEQSSSALQWQSKSDEQLNLAIFRDICRDQYGTEYDYRATMELNGKLYSGCARRGSLDMLSLPGLYQAKLPEIEAVKRSIKMQLSEDGSVTLTQDYHNDQPLVIHTGNWQRLPKKRLVIYLNNIAGTEDNQALLLQRNKQGALEMKGYNALYGSSGLMFYPQSLNAAEETTVPAATAGPLPD